MLVLLSTILLAEVNDVLLLEWSLHDHILPAGVEIGNRVAVRALTYILSTDTVKICLEAIIRPSH